MKPDSQQHLPISPARRGWGYLASPASYYLYDVVLRSQIPLPELMPCADTDAAVVIRQLETLPPDAGRYELCYEWRDIGGRLVCQVAQFRGCYQLTLPDQASFFITEQGAISCFAFQGTRADLLRHLLLSQALPRYLAHRGALMLHASAVTLASGHTVAFLGASGQGKSTLASYCHRQGGRIVDDDCIRVQQQAGAVSLSGGVPTIRLYPDSLTALGYPREDLSPVVDATGKRQVALSGQVSATGAQARSLDALFILDPSGGSGACDHVSIEPVAGQSAVWALVSSAFNLDPSNPQTRARTLQYAAQLVNSQVPVYNLRFPRELAGLPQVLQTIQELQCLQ